jgi:hypothetical protein
MGSFKEILMPKTIVFGKGELVFFLFHALRRPVESIAVFGGDGHGILFLFILKEKFLGREFERGAFFKKPLSHKKLFRYPK